MKKQLSVCWWLVAAIFFTCVSLSFALTPSGVIVFVDDSLRMTPGIASDNTRVTFTFQVRNNGPRINNVQIRVMEPVNDRGEGRVLVDVPRQVLNRGVNTYTVSGNFKLPGNEAEKHVLIQLLDRNTSVLPAPVLVHSGSRQLLPAGYRLGPPVVLQ